MRQRIWWNFPPFPAVPLATCEHININWKSYFICVTSKMNILYPFIYSITTIWNNHSDMGQRSHFWSQYTTVTVVYLFKNSSTLNNLLRLQWKVNPASRTWNHSHDPKCWVCQIKHNTIQVIFLSDLILWILIRLEIHAHIHLYTN